MSYHMSVSLHMYLSHHVSMNAQQLLSSRACLKTHAIVLQVRNDYERHGQLKIRDTITVDFSRCCDCLCRVAGCVLNVCCAGGCVPCVTVCAVLLNVCGVAGCLRCC